MKTQRTLTANDPQRVLKSIAPQEEIAVSIAKEVNGKELDNVLKGVAAFTSVFNENDKYKLDVKVIKIIEDVIKDGESELQSN